MAKSIRSGDSIVYGCPGCKVAGAGGFHSIPVEGAKAWGFNNNLDAPTLTPSVLAKSGTFDNPGELCHTCHHFLRNGKLEYLGDCTHEFAGQTLDLPEIERHPAGGIGFADGTRGLSPMDAMEKML